MQFKTNEIALEDFTVSDCCDNLVTGLVAGDFTVTLYNPSGTEVSGIIPVTITELGGGSYRSSFTPNVKGIWYLNIVHPEHFPWGKSANLDVLNNDMDDVSSQISSLDSTGIINITQKLDDIAVQLSRALGLMQENFYIDQTIYDDNHNMTQSRIRIYSLSSSVGTNNDVIATYIMNADYDSNNDMTSYKVTKQ